MTNQELKMILKLIDLHSTEKSNGRDCSTKIIEENSITRLKKDIQELFKELTEATITKYGDWERKETDGGTLAMCSQCNYLISYWHKTNYCPNCGADMKGD